MWVNIFNCPKKRVHSFVSIVIVNHMQVDFLLWLIFPLQNCCFGSDANKRVETLILILLFSEKNLCLDSLLACNNHIWKWKA
jgi:hypothetical protein